MEEFKSQNQYLVDKPRLEKLPEGCCQTQAETPVHQSNQSTSPDIRPNIDGSGNMAETVLGRCEPVVDPPPNLLDETQTENVDGPEGKVRDDPKGDGSETNEHPAIPFLRRLFRKCGNGTLNLRFLGWDKPDRNEFLDINTIERIPEILNRYEGQNMYFGVALRDGSAEKPGKKEGIYLIPGVWLDHDNVTPETAEKIKNSPCPPSMIVQSSIPTKWQVYYLWKEPLGKDGIDQIEDLIGRLIHYFGGDPGAKDASRVLRIPGTRNLKQDKDGKLKYDPPPTVKVIEVNEHEYSPSDFDWLPPVQSQVEKSLKDSTEASAEVNGHLNQIMECEFIQHCDRDRITLPEPEWYMMTNILCHQPGGKSLIHKLSEGYPGYSRKETDEKILHALDMPPYSCERIKTVWDCGKNCGVTSPAVLGAKSRQKSFPEKSENMGSEQSHHFTFVKAKDIVDSEECVTEWVWEGVIPCGGSALIVAKPKVGKTTMATNLAVCVARGQDFLGRKTKQCTVAYLALEHKKSEMKRALRALGVDDEPLFIHFGQAPHGAIKEVRSLIKDTGAKFLIIDILQKFFRANNIADYAELTSLMEQIVAICMEEDCSVAFNHHAGKQERLDGDNVLGSTALLGGVDTGIIIRKIDPGRPPRQRRRTFYTIQRYGEDIPETILRLLPDGSLKTEGTLVEVELEEVMSLIMKTLEPGIEYQEQEIKALINKGSSMISEALRELFQRGELRRQGRGVKGSPFTYEK